MSNMKNFIAGFFAVFMLFVIALPAFSDPVDNTNKVEYYKPMVYINDAVTPNVKPNYGKPEFVYAKNERVETFNKKVIAKANSPPYIALKGV